MESRLPRTKCCVLLSAILLLTSLSACGSTSASPTLTLENIPTENLHTSTPEFTSTNNPPMSTPLSATITSSPTQIPILTSTITASPTTVVTLSQKGPWLALSSQYGLWVMNLDGSAFTQVAIGNELGGNQLNFTIAPHGGRIALILVPYDPGSFVSNPPELMLVALPSTSLHTLTRIHSGKSLQSDSQFEDPNSDVYGAILRRGSMSWSPDGSMLAFISAQEGPSADLYVYSMLDRTIIRLTSGPTQSIDPMWSPDGNYIVSGGARRMNMYRGGSSGPTMDAIWAVRPDGSDLHKVASYPEENDGAPLLLGWVNNEAYLEYFDVLGCGVSHLSFIDILVPRKIPIISGSFISAALDLSSGILLVLSLGNTDLPYCGSSPDPGLYLMSVFGDRAPQKLPFDIASMIVDKRMISWSPTAKVFFVSAGKGTFTVDRKGAMMPLNIPDYHPMSIEVSPDGKKWAFFDSDGLWIASRDRTPISIIRDDVRDVIWTPNGSALFYLSREYATSSFTLYQATTPEFQPVAIGGPWMDDSLGQYQLEWVMP